jgi:conjugal transfer pilin signal peptidase TrbI
LRRRPIDWRAYRAGAIRTAIIFVVSALALGYFSARYRIGLDGQAEITCLPHRAFLIDTWDRTLARGDLFAFRATKMEPFVRNGITVVKVLRGLPGDRLRVDGEVFVNGEREGVLLEGSLQKIGKTAAHLKREELIPPGHLFAMGEHERSYDSRYWGYVEDERVIGRAYALW